MDEIGRARTGADRRSDAHADAARGERAAACSRRDALRRLGLMAGVAWSAPVVLSVASPAAAAGTPAPGTTTSTSTTLPPAECVGGTCQEFPQCSSNADCVCAITADGGTLCLPGSVGCNSLDVCGPNLDCPPGFTCVIESCCAGPVCVPLSVAEECPPDAALVGTRGARQSTGPGTLGG
jgi:hypothetical protein